MKVCDLVLLIEADGWSRQEPYLAFGNKRNWMRRNKMPHFLIVIEKTSNNYSAYSPDLPGCVATGATVEAVRGNMHEAIEMHIQGLIEDRLPIPEPHALADYVTV
jgi:predicted RNase H-like HicB family nuclease